MTLRWRLKMLSEGMCEVGCDGIRKVYKLIEKFAEKLNEFAMRVA